MKKFLLSIFTVMLAVFSVQAQEVVYNLVPANGSNSSYASNCDITIDGITWNLTGNSQMDPWRIGGKSITNVDRALYSKTPLNSAVSKVVLAVGEASSITVNNAKLLIADNVDFNNATEYPFTFEANSSIEIPVSAASDSYYKFVFNVTVSGNKNKFIEFISAEFYAAAEEGVVAKPTFDPVSGTTFEESLEVVINATDGAAIHYTLNGEEPTTDSETYSDPIVIDETSTVKAIAVVDGVSSSVAAATYTKLIDLNGCSVADAIEAYGSGQTGDATIVGYIVGCVDGTALSKAVFGNEVSTNSNILLADDPYETNIDNCIPVQLPSGNVRDDLNLENNPDNYQKKVILTGNLEAYFSVAGLKKTSAYEFVEMFYNTITVSDAGWATLYLPTTARIPSNVEAYTVTAVNDGWVSLTQVTGVIPANTGIIVKANVGEYDLIVGETATADVTGNLLEGTLFNKNIEEEAYVLGKVDGVVGLYKAEMTDGVWLNNAFKAYLPASALTPAQQTAAFYGFDWEGTTGIEKVEIRNEKSEIYDLTGRRVEEITAPGIYVVNGKKVLVK